MEAWVSEAQKLALANVLAAGRVVVVVSGDSNGARWSNPASPWRDMGNLKKPSLSA
jgi:hypothetical protein